MRILFLSFAILSFAQSLLAEKIEGVVRDTLGHPIHRALVVEQTSGQTASTDVSGYFQLELELDQSVSRVLQLTVSHPTFQAAYLEVQLPRSGALLVELEAHQMFSEEVVVTAGYTPESRAPVGAAAAMVSSLDRNESVSTVSDVAVAVPGVALNSQGGHFQNFSIRGVSRQRIISAISGVRLTSERRAGASASFIDPFLIEGVGVLRGPSSSFYGSGALGGVIEIIPRRFQRGAARNGWSSAGNERFFAGGWGDGQFSVGAAVRKAENTESPDGSELNTHFTQYSAAVSQRWSTQSADYELLVLPSYAWDIGKSNTDYPQRTTHYPRERHLITKFSVHSANRWRINSFFHAQDLLTTTLQTGQTYEVENSSLDFGFDVKDRLPVARDMTLEIGAEYFGRRNVDARELATDSATGEREESFTLDNGRENELGLSASLTKAFQRIELEGGVRLTVLNQANPGQQSATQSAWNAFLGAAIPLTQNLEASGSVGTGLRFPSLSERFFSGTTGRGEIVANSMLEPERSANWEAGIRWFGSQFYASAYYFRNRISDYIERIELEPDLLTFVNLIDGTIQGFEWEAAATPFTDWQLFARGHFITGSDQRDAPLSDIPEDRLILGFWHHSGRLRVGSELQLRAAKENPGSGEKEIGSTEILSASLGFDLTEKTRFACTLENILNREYFITADRKSPLAPARSLSIGLSWELD